MPMTLTLEDDLDMVKLNQ